MPPFETRNEIGFNPFDLTIEERPVADATVSTITSTDGGWATVVDGSVFIDTPRTFRDIQEAYAVLSGSDSTRPTQRVSKDKPKQKSISKLLDEISAVNKDVFDSVSKIQEEIETLERKRIVELADKYDNLLFLVIGKNYTLEGAAEKVRAAYHNTLTQQLTKVIDGVVSQGSPDFDNFNLAMLRNVSRYVELDDDAIAKFGKLFEELYEYYNLIKAKKEEKRCLMGREQKKETVCEDYINFTVGGNGVSSDPRMELRGRTILSLSTEY